jgi:tetratricopeptide (TPR) repeat protein/DNA-binding CsgD family transcriptional regulator
MELPQITKSYAELNRLDDVSLTRREIDIISCIMQGRTSKKSISAFLSTMQKPISYRTVEHHTQNIIGKINGSSWEDIRKTIEILDIADLFRKHYEIIKFDRMLQEIIGDIRANTIIFPIKIYLYYEKDQPLKFKHDIEEIIQYFYSHSFEITLKTIPKNYIFDVQETAVTKKQMYIVYDGMTFSPTNLETPHIYYYNYSYNNNVYQFVLFLLKRLINNPESLLNLKKQLEKFHSTLPQKELIFQNAPSIISRKLLTLCIFLSFSIIIILVWEINVIYFKKKNRVSADLSIPRASILLERNQITRKIKDMLFSNAALDEKISLVSLVGIGGSGKTTLARLVGAKSISSVFWEIKAESVDTIRSSFALLAYCLAETPEQKNTLDNILRIQKQDEKEQQILKFVQIRLKERPGWLLIFDNIETIQEINSYIPHDPSIWGVGKIIFTTRNNNIRKHNMIQIDALTSQEAFELFTKILFQDNIHKPGKDDIKIRTFLQHIPPFPLDVSIAANYLLQTGIKYSEYLDRMNQPSFHLTQKEILKDLEVPLKMRDSLVLLTLQNIYEFNHQFDNLIVLLCILDSQMIPRRLLELSTNKITVDLFIQSLKKHSLVIPNMLSSEYFSIHQSIHDTMRKLLLQSRPELSKNITSMLQLIISYIDEVINKEIYFEMNGMKRHLSKTLEFSNIPKMQGAILSTKIACLYTHLGVNTQTVIQIFEQALPILRTHPGANKLHIAQALTYLGDAYKRLGKYSKSIPLLMESISIYRMEQKAQLGLAQALTYLGATKRIQGDYLQAKKMLTQACDVYKELPDQHPGEAQNLIYLGLVYKDVGEYSSAEKVIESGLKYWKNNGNDPMWIAWAGAYLANVFIDTGEFDRAKIIIEECIELHKQHINSEIWLAWANTILAGAYLGLKDPQKAKNLLEQSRTIYEKKHTDNYVYFTILLILLGDAYIELGHFDQAQAVLEKSLKMSESHYGVGHIQTGKNLYSLGMLYLKKKKLQLAEDYFKKASDIFEPFGHPNITLVLEGLEKLKKQKMGKKLGSG